MASAYKEVFVALRGGLNTALDPSIIGDDQLTESYGMEYRPPRIGLFAVPGRSRVDATATAIKGNKIYGLVYAQFDLQESTRSDGSTSEAYLYGLHSPSATAFVVYGSSDSNNNVNFVQMQPFNGVWSSFSFSEDWSASATAFADAVHYNNTWFFYNGANLNFCVQNQNPGKYLQHGMGDVTATASVVATATASSGTFTAGTYQVWYTDQGESPTKQADGDVIFSAYSGDPMSVTLSASAMGISLTLPASAPYNENSGFYTVWCSPVGGSYPYGFEGTLGSGSTTNTAGNSFTFWTVDDSTPYPVVGPIGGIPVSANSRPPKAYSMRAWQNSLVCIDTEDRQTIKYSLPDEPHYFPAINYIPLDTSYQDKLTALEICNDNLLVFSRFYGYRINYLPRHTDSEDMTSARGNCFTRFSEAHGCVSPRGTAVFSPVGGVELCLFVCRDGIHITDGDKSSYATEDIDWYNTVDLASLHRSVLKNNPKYNRIEFYYVDKTTTTSIYRLDFYYHPSLIQKGAFNFPKLPVLGPTRVPGLSPALGVFNNDWNMYCGREDAASIWSESTGTTDNAALENADGRVTRSWATKDFYFAGLHGEYELFKVYTHQSQTTASGTYTITAEGRIDDHGGTFYATSTVDQSLNGAQPHPAFHQRGQRFSVRGEKTDGGAWQELNYLVFVVKGAQELHSAKSSA